MRTPLAALLVGQSAPEESEPEQPGAAPVLESFDLDALARERTEGGQRWNAFLDRPTLSAGLYGLPPGAEDGQSPHAEDEVHHVVQGRAVLEVGEAHPRGAGRGPVRGRRRRAPLRRDRGGPRGAGVLLEGRPEAPAGTGDRALGPPTHEAPRGRLAMARRRTRIAELKNKSSRAIATTTSGHPDWNR